MRYFIAINLIICAGIGYVLWNANPGESCNAEGIEHLRNTFPHFAIAYTLLMLLRALYIIFEKIEVDTEGCEIKFRILRKKVPFATIRSIKRVRTGQLRIETSNGLVPFSVDEEEDFIRTIKKAVPSIKID
jgi:hypothetical protein